MKASDILRSAQGQIAGGLSRLDDTAIRIRALARVADDVASGITPLEGIDTQTATALAMALEREVDQLDALSTQMRTGYAYLVRLSSMLQPS